MTYKSSYQQMNNRYLLFQLGVKNKIFGGKREDTHWLDTTETKYEKRFIREVKKTLSILMLFMALPMFWALLDQMVSNNKKNINDRTVEIFIDNI